MKARISITLPGELLAVIDKQAGSPRNRSVFISEALRSYFTRFVSSTHNPSDREIINRNASRLNREAADVLTYQRFRSIGQQF